MCGISGIIGEPRKNLLKKMNRIIQHRGPDDSGIFLDKNIGLGIQRLSIIDLEGGKQPIHNEDESIWIVYNGETYNYLELKEALEKKNHKFYTNSDTEVVVHLYEEFGEKCVSKLRGMFAFAIWDGNKEKLLLARDRLGIKPLYYTIIDNNLIFGSEIKSILQDPRIERKVDYQALHDYLSFQFVPGPRTMFKDIKKLQPGHILVWKNGKFSISKYWDLTKHNPVKNSEKYYCKCLLNLLKESVKMRLISDVPLGVYLSGGIDSSCLAALASEASERPVKTFSVGFGISEKYDELKYAQIVANYLNTDHHELLSKENSIKIIPKVIWHLDEPIADSAAIPTYLISELTKKHVTVVLGGEGADELFMGYRRYKITYLANKYSKILSNSFKKDMNWILEHIYKNIPDIGKLKRYTNFASEFSSSINDPLKTYMVFFNRFPEKERKMLYTNEIVKNNVKQSSETIKKYIKSNNVTLQMFYFDAKVYLPDDLLIKIDKMSMANSLEGRVPFLDHKIVEFVSNIPINFKIKVLTEKYILRKTVSNLLPKVITKRKKHTFNVPLTHWFKGELGEIASQILSESSVHKKYFNSKYIRRILGNNKLKPNYNQIWPLLVFEIWHKIYIDSQRMKKINLKHIF